MARVTSLRSLPAAALCFYGAFAAAAGADSATILWKGQPHPVTTAGADFQVAESARALGFEVATDPTTGVVTLARNWNEYFAQIVQMYGCYSNAGIFVPGLERAYGIYNIFICHVTPKVDVNFRSEWYDDVDGLSYPGGTGFKNGGKAGSVIK